MAQINDYNKTCISLLILSFLWFVYLILYTYTKLFMSFFIYSYIFWFLFYKEHTSTYVRLYNFIIT